MTLLQLACHSFRNCANIAQQPDSQLLPFIETVRTQVDSPRDEVEAVRAENQRLKCLRYNLIPA